MNKICVALLICLSIQILPTIATIEESIVLHSFEPQQEVSCPPLEGYGYFWDGQKCEVCMPNCKCDSYLGCVECREGYGRLYHKHHTNREPEPACYKCQENRTDGVDSGADENHVASCCFQKSESEYHAGTGGFRSFTVRALRALSCQESYGLTKVVQFGSYCFSTTYCQTYTEYGRCTKCADGYYLQDYEGNNRCVQCSTNCALCSGPDSCEQCDASHYNPSYTYAKANNSLTETQLNNLENNPYLCLPCSQSNCECNETNRCTKCINEIGHFHRNNESCRSCNTVTNNCLTCNETECSECREGYKLNGSGKCVKCPNHCSSKFCELVDSSTKCTAGGCYNGYYFKEDTRTCEACPSPMARCTVNSNGDIVPTQCQQDNVTPAAGTKGYEWVLASLPIHSHNSFLIEQGDQLVCAPNSQLQCRKMKTKIGADDDRTCVSCYEDFGYFLNEVSKQCDKCTKSNCVECGYNNENLICRTCYQGRNFSSQPSQDLHDNEFNYHAIEGECEKCNEGCLKCDSDLTCDTCQHGFRALAQRNCERCDETNCKKCNDNKAICQECFDGFRLWRSKEATAPGEEFKCEACEPQCLSCQQDRKVCTKCADQYYLFNGVCRPVREKCLEHQADGACKHCMYGYRNVQGYCFDCTTAGYINCPVGCTSKDSYMRDGDVLTKEYYDQRIEELYKPISGSVLQFISAACILIASLLI